MCLSLAIQSETPEKVKEVANTVEIKVFFMVVSKKGLVSKRLFSPRGFVVCPPLGKANQATKCYRIFLRSFCEQCSGVENSVLSKSFFHADSVPIG